MWLICAALHTPFPVAIFFIWRCMFNISYVCIVYINSKRFLIIKHIGCTHSWFPQIFHSKCTFIIIRSTKGTINFSSKVINKQWKLIITVVELWFCQVCPPAGTRHTDWSSTRNASFQRFGTSRQIPIVTLPAPSFMVAERFHKLIC